MLSYQSSTAEWDFFFGPNKLKAHNGLYGALILFCSPHDLWNDFGIILDRVNFTGRTIREV